MWSTPFFFDLFLSPIPTGSVTFWGSAPEMGLPAFNYPDAFYVYFRNRSRTLQNISAYSYLGMTLTEAGDPERVVGASVTVDFFRLLGKAPLHGRTFLAEEVQKDRNQVAVLSHGLWQRRFEGDPGIVGKALMLDGRPVTVVGIMPPGFDFPRHPGPSELWVPLGIEPESLSCWCRSTIGRLASGSNPDDVAREISRLSDDFWRDREGRPRIDPNGAEASKSVVIARPLARNMVFEVRTPLLVLLGAVGMVLLIACANVANLQLARSAARGREIAVRCCLGASPWRIARQLLVESLLLAAGGAVLGLGLVHVSLRAMGHLVAERVAHVPQVELHPGVLLFTVAVSLVAGVLFGLAPAWRGARLELHEAVKEGARGSGGPRSRRLSQAFVVVPVRPLIGAPDRRGAPPAELPEPAGRGPRIPAGERPRRPGLLPSRRRPRTRQGTGVLRPARRARLLVCPASAAWASPPPLLSATATTPGPS